jgi:hypothetical protein
LRPTGYGYGLPDNDARAVMDEKVGGLDPAVTLDEPPGSDERKVWSSSVEIRNEDDTSPPRVRRS